MPFSKHSPDSYRLNSVWIGQKEYIRSGCTYSFLLVLPLDFRHCGSVASLVSLANLCREGTVTLEGSMQKWQGNERDYVELNPFREVICGHVIKCTDVNCFSSSHAWLPCCPTSPVCACREHMIDVTNRRFREGVVWEQRCWELAHDRLREERVTSLGREKKQYSG